MWSLVAAPALAALALVAAPRELASQACEAPYRVSREEIQEAMRAHGDYSLTSTTTSMLFGARTLLELVRHRQRRDPRSTQLLIGHDVWFDAHRETAGVSYAEMSASARAGFEHRQDALVDYGPRVVERTLEGPTPRTALDVTLFWPDSGDAPASFHYRDTLSVPQVDVFNDRIVRFKIVEYPDMLVFDRISGLSVRPLGFFSALFAVLGKPDLEETRLAVSRDYWQVVRGRVKVFPGISKTGTGTIEPDGRGHKWIPKERPDLKELWRRLRQPVEVRYGPPSCRARLILRGSKRDCMGVMGGAGACAGD